MRNAVACVVLMLGLGAQSAPLFATTVYTWTDAQGVRHFSQYPPTDPAQTAETLNYETGPTTPESADRLQTIRDVARDLEASRQQREEQRAKAAPPPTPTPAPAEPYEPSVDVVPYPYFGAPYPPPYPHLPPPHRRGPHPGEPEEPDHRPPMKDRKPSGQVR